MLVPGGFVGPVCCRGLASTYRVAVGRSAGPTGPFVDADTGGTIRMQIREIEWRDGWPYFSDDDSSPPR